MPETCNEYTYQRARTRIEYARTYVAIGKTVDVKELLTAVEVLQREAEAVNTLTEQITELESEIDVLTDKLDQIRGIV